MYRYGKVRRGKARQRQDLSSLLGKAAARLEQPAQWPLLTRRHAIAFHLFWEVFCRARLQGFCGSLLHDVPLFWDAAAGASVAPLHGRRHRGGPLLESPQGRYARGGLGRAYDQVRVLRADYDHEVRGLVESCGCRVCCGRPPFMYPYMYVCVCARAHTQGEGEGERERCGRGASGVRERGRARRRAREN